MPATEDVWRNLRKLHVVSAASALALLASTLWMMQADYADEWRGIQRTANKLQAEQLDDDIRDLLELNHEEFTKIEAQLTSKVDAAKNALQAERNKVAPVEKEVNQLDGQSQRLTREVKFKRAERDATRAELDLKVRDGVLGKGLKPFQENFDAVQKTVDSMEVALQELQTKFDAAKEKLAELTKPL